jgi:hypothetical protein
MRRRRLAFGMKNIHAFSVSRAKGAGGGGRLLYEREAHVFAADFLRRRAKLPFARQKALP